MPLSVLRLQRVIVVYTFNMFTLNWLKDYTCDE